MVKKKIYIYKKSRMIKLFIPHSEKIEKSIVGKDIIMLKNSTVS